MLETANMEEDNILIKIQPNSTFIMYNIKQNPTKAAWSTIQKPKTKCPSYKTQFKLLHSPT